MKGSPHGFAALNPYFTVKDADGFIAFLSVVSMLKLSKIIATRMDQYNMQG